MKRLYLPYDLRYKETKFLEYEENGGENLLTLHDIIHYSKIVLP